MEEAGEVTRILGDEAGTAARVEDGEVEGEFEAVLQEEIKLRIQEGGAALKRNVPKSVMIRDALLRYPFLASFSHQPRLGWDESNKTKFAPPPPRRLGVRVTGSNQL